MQNLRKFFRVAVFLCCTIFLLSPASTVVHAAGEDGDVEGLWLRIPEFPDDAEVVEFNADEDGEVNYTRSIDGGRFVLSILRSTNEDNMTPEKMKEAIAESAKDSGVDPDDINFDSGAESFAEKLSFPCVTAEYEIGEKDEAKQIAIIGVFTEDYFFLVHVAVAADSFDDYTDRTREWFKGMELVGGPETEEEGRGDLFDDETGEKADKKIDFVAVVYSLPDFRGVPWKISSPGNYDLARGFDIPNDSISSVAVCPGYRVTLYEHSRFGGESAEIEENTEDLGERKGWASSLKVEKTEEPDLDLALEWVAVQSENEGNFEEIDLDTAAAAKALKIHAKRMKLFQGAGEMHWFGKTKDGERVMLGKELIKIFSDLGVDMDNWEENSFAQAINNFYDWRKDLSVWDKACMILNLDPKAFKQ